MTFTFKKKKLKLFSPSYYFTNTHTQIYIDMHAFKNTDTPQNNMC